MSARQTAAANTRRSQLFVPACRPRYMAAAAKQPADGLILDLEDSVPLPERPAARATLVDALARLSASHYVSVRVNKAIEELVPDLDAAVTASTNALVLPKVASGTEVRVLDALVAERELRLGMPLGTTEFQILIETCEGVANSLDIATSSPRIVSMTLGVEDLATELETDPGHPDFDVTWAHSQVLMAARAAGVAPYGLLNSLSNVTDLTLLTGDVRRSRAFGFVGAFCIHPNQVPVLNRGFAPSADEVSAAEAVVAVLEDAEQRGSGAAILDGRMIDAPVAERARRLLQRSRGRGSSEPKER